MSIVHALLETEDQISSFQVNFPSLYLKTPKNLWFLIFFRGLEREY